MMDVKVGKTYKLTKKLGEGAFGYLKKIYSNNFMFLILDKYSVVLMRKLKWMLL